MYMYMQQLPRVPPYLRSNSEVERRRDYLVQMESSLSVEAREILPGLIIECLDNNPSNRPTSRRLIEALGTRTCVHGVVSYVVLVSLDRQGSCLIPKFKGEPACKDREPIYKVGGKNNTPHTPLPWNKPFGYYNSNQFI